MIHWPLTSIPGAVSFKSVRIRSPDLTGHEERHLLKPVGVLNQHAGALRRDLDLNFS